MTSKILLKNAGVSQADSSGRIISDSYDMEAENGTAFFHVTGVWGGAEAIVEIMKYGHDTWVPINETQLSDDQPPLILDLSYGCRIRVVIEKTSASTNLIASI